MTAKAEAICPICKTRPIGSDAPNAKFCYECALARRTWQLVINNQKWKLKKEAGEAGHRVMYNGKPTQWARDNPVQAVREAIKQGYTDEQLTTLLEGFKSGQ